MAPKKPQNLAAAAAMKKKKKKSKKPKEKGKKHKKITTKKKKLKLSESERKKSLYICSLEHHEGSSVSYVIRAIKLSRLLSSSSSDGDLQLRQVGYKAGPDLPGHVGCGVRQGSRIVFAGGLRPVGAFARVRDADSVLHKEMYSFETSEHQEIKKEIKKMDAALLGGKIRPLLVEIGGKLYALCYNGEPDPPAFEVFDTELDTWSALPQPPFFQRGSRYDLGHAVAYVIAGTKIFVSGERCPVFCFDVSRPESDWRRVPTMCEGSHFPFFREALVLDLPGAGGNKKILFGVNHVNRLGVYLVTGLDGNEESVMKIGDFKMPVESFWELGEPGASDIVHIGGNKACIVITHFICPRDDKPRWNEPGTHKTQGVVLPFEFEIDMAKLDRDARHCCSIQFLPPRIFQYHTNPDTFPRPDTVGCFVL